MPPKSYEVKYIIAVPTPELLFQGIRTLELSPEEELLTCTRKSIITGERKGDGSYAQLHYTPSEGFQATKIRQSARRFIDGAAVDQISFFFNHSEAFPSLREEYLPSLCGRGSYDPTSLIFTFASRGNKNNPDAFITPDTQLILHEHPRQLELFIGELLPVEQRRQLAEWFTALAQRYGAQLTQPKK